MNPMNSMTGSNVYEIHIDGSCKGNPGPGGWGIVIIKNGSAEQRWIAGFPESDTTNNRMEVTAAIEALEKIPVGSTVALYTDSDYFRECMGFDEEGNRKEPNRRHLNRDLFEILDKLVELFEVTILREGGHVKGENPFNHVADVLAKEGSMNRQEIDIQVDLDVDVDQVSEEYAKQILANKSANPVKNKQEKDIDVDQGSENNAVAMTHIDDAGDARMVDVGEKNETERVAVARGRVTMQPETLTVIAEGAASKGDIQGTARLAGIMAAKETSRLIPLCHPIALTNVSVDFEIVQPNTLEIESTAKAVARTGVEMEALTATTIAALTIYDMVKAIDRGMRIEEIRLVWKEGGKSGVIKLE